MIWTYLSLDRNWDMLFLHDQGYAFDVEGHYTAEIIPSLFCQGGELKPCQLPGEAQSGQSTARSCSVLLKISLFLCISKSVSFALIRFFLMMLSAILLSLRKILLNFRTIPLVSIYPEEADCLREDFLLSLPGNNSCHA